jgi:hypothetical protein
VNEKKIRRYEMKHPNNKYERESDSKNSFSSYFSINQSLVMKRLLLLVISIFMVFAAAQSTPTTKANAPCDMECTEYIDPSDGQCYRTCCPIDTTCKIRCFIMPCEK